MKTLNAHGFRRYRQLLRDGVPPKRAHEVALSEPENQSTFKQGRKK